MQNMAVLYTFHNLQT